MTLLDVKRLVPEDVAAFSDEAENLIHSDPQVARRFGYRAPIAAGLMASHFMMEMLARPGTVERLEMEIRFLRPMFWDDELRIFGAERDGRLAELAIVNPEGKPTSRGWVRSISYRD